MSIIDGSIKRPAVFLDRDGVLIKEKSYIISLDQIEIFPYTADCIRQIHQKGYYAIVITNQSGIARGLFTEMKLQEMNRYLIQQIKIDALYYCPHHPEGKLMEYRKVCNCRKPKAGMFEKACQSFNIDMQNSYMVGDRADDIMAGKNVRAKTILLESGYGTDRLEYQIEPDYVLNDLRDVIEILPEAKMDSAN